MKYNEFKESLKKKAQNLKEIKIGLKESQRTLFFNSFDMHGKHHGLVWSHIRSQFTDEQLRRYDLALKQYVKCTSSFWAAYRDYRARHIAYSLFRGRTPEQIESNYYEGKWNEYPHKIQDDINKHLEGLKRDNTSVAQRKSREL